LLGRGLRPRRGAEDDLVLAASELVAQLLELARRAEELALEVGAAHERVVGRREDEPGLHVAHSLGERLVLGLILGPGAERGARRRQRRRGARDRVVFAARLPGDEDEEDDRSEGESHARTLGIYAARESLVPWSLAWISVHVVFVLVGLPRSGRRRLDGLEPVGVEEAARLGRDPLVDHELLRHGGEGGERQPVAREVLGDRDGAVEVRLVDLAA